MEDSPRQDGHQFDIYLDVVVCQGHLTWIAPIRCRAPSIQFLSICLSSLWRDIYFQSHNVTNEKEMNLVPS